MNIVSRENLNRINEEANKKFGYSILSISPTKWDDERKFLCGLFFYYGTFEDWRVHSYGSTIEASVTNFVIDHLGREFIKELE